MRAASLILLLAASACRRVDPGPVAPAPALATTAAAVEVGETTPVLRRTPRPVTVTITESWRGDLTPGTRLTLWMPHDTPVLVGTSTLWVRPHAAIFGRPRRPGVAVFPPVADGSMVHAAFLRTVPAPSAPWGWRAATPGRPAAPPVPSQGREPAPTPAGLTLTATPMVPLVPRRPRIPDGVVPAQPAEPATDALDGSLSVLLTVANPTNQALDLPTLRQSGGRIRWRDAVAVAWGEHLMALPACPGSPRGPSQPTSIPAGGQISTVVDLAELQHVGAPHRAPSTVTVAIGDLVVDLAAWAPPARHASLHARARDRVERGDCDP